MSEKTEDYEVGYGKPPKHTQFKKGQSGNKRGRPKGANNFKTDLMKTLKAQVPVIENGRQRTVSTQLATLMRLREKALKGDEKALGRLLAFAVTFNNEEAGSDAQGLLPEADKALIDRALSRRQGAPKTTEEEADDE